MKKLLFITLMAASASLFSCSDDATLQEEQSVVAAATSVDGNMAPVATNPQITGTIQATMTANASYIYSDNENDLEDGTTFEWFTAVDSNGTGEILIAGATSSTYQIQEVDEYKYIRVAITPQAATGTTTGAKVYSSYTMVAAAPKYDGEIDPTTGLPVNGRTK